MPAERVHGTRRAEEIMESSCPVTQIIHPGRSNAAIASDCVNRAFVPYKFGCQIRVRPALQSSAGAKCNGSIPRGAEREAFDFIDAAADWADDE